MSNKEILQCNNMSKSYYDTVAEVNVLKEINLSIHSGERIAIVGSSGSGKSTLLHLLGGLDFPNKGSAKLNGLDWKDLSEAKRCNFRNKMLGFIYQFHHLLPEFNALENVAMPVILSGSSGEKALNAAEAILDKVGLKNRVTHKPAQLSGGERQRVAIARALVNNPQCVLADEPTGNLDHTTAMHVFDEMLRLNHEMQTALVVVTHDQVLAKRMQKIFSLKDGILECVS